MSTAASPEIGQPLSAWMGTLIDYVQSARPDLTNRQMALLMVVYLLPGPHTVRGLAARLRVSKPVVTRALNTLGALGYLRRQKDEFGPAQYFHRADAAGPCLPRGVRRTDRADRGA